MSLPTDSRTFVEHAPALFDPEVLRRLRADLDALEREGRESRSAHEEQIVRSGAMPDAVRLETRWYDAWRRAVPGRLERIAPFAWVVFPPQVRHVREPEHLVPWHQDVGYMKLVRSRAHSRIVTCFVPIDEEPARRTTVQFAAEATAETLEHGAGGRHGAAIRGREIAPGPHFALALGDALLFGDHAVHRTFVPPGADLDRRSLEFRLVKPDEALDDKDYFDVARGLFVRTDGSAREDLR